MKKALYLHGFLGGPDDMRPLFLDDHECESVDVRQFLNKPEELMKRYDGPYEFSVAYSYGGRLLAKCLELDPSFVKKPLFCSSRITGFSDEELEQRKIFKCTLLKKLESSTSDFMNYWHSLPLFGGHNMNNYRRMHNIDHKPWSRGLILSFLSEHFTYKPPVLKGFEFNSWYIYGENDEKYKKESLKLKMKHFEFSDLGHRFLYQEPEFFKEILKTRVLS